MASNSQGWMKISDWLFYGQDFKVWTVTTETVLSHIFLALHETSKRKNRNFVFIILKIDPGLEDDSWAPVVFHKTPWETKWNTFYFHKHLRWPTAICFAGRQLNGWQVTTRWVRGSVAEWLEYWTCNPEVPPWPLAGIFLGGPEFKYSRKLVNSQLVCLLPVGILNHIMYHLNEMVHYFWQAP